MIRVCDFSVSSCRCIGLFSVSLGLRLDLFFRGRLFRVRFVLCSNCNDFNFISGFISYVVGEFLNSAISGGRDIDSFISVLRDVLYKYYSLGFARDICFGVVIPYGVRAKVDVVSYGRCRVYVLCDDGFEAVDGDVIFVDEDSRVLFTCSLNSLPDVIPLGSLSKFSSDITYCCYSHYVPVDVLKGVRCGHISGFRGVSNLGFYLSVRYSVNGLSGDFSIFGFVGFDGGSVGSVPIAVAFISRFLCDVLRRLLFYPVDDVDYVRSVLSDSFDGTFRFFAGSLSSSNRFLRSFAIVFVYGDYAFIIHDGRSFIQFFDGGARIVSPRGFVGKLASSCIGGFVLRFSRGFRVLFDVVRCMSGSGFYSILVSNVCLLDYVRLDGIKRVLVKARFPSLVCDVFGRFFRKVGVDGVILCYSCFRFVSR